MGVYNTRKEDNGGIVQVDGYRAYRERASFGHIDRLMIARNKGQTVTWSRGHVMDRFRRGSARELATAFNPDYDYQQTTDIDQPLEMVPNISNSFQLHQV